eukprot:5017541-Amphidinium_carterae.1
MYPNIAFSLCACQGNAMQAATPQAAADVEVKPEDYGKWAEYYRQCADYFTKCGLLLTVLFLSHQVSVAPVPSLVRARSSDPGPLQDLVWTIGQAIVQDATSRRHD